jgi:hypothetical protein
MLDFRLDRSGWYTAQKLAGNQFPESSAHPFNVHLEDSPEAQYYHASRFMDWKPVLTRSLTTAATGAIIGSAFYGVDGSKVLPISGISAPAPVFYAVTTASGSILADVLLMVLGNQSFLVDKTSRSIVGIGVGAYGGAYLMRGQSDGSMWEDFIVVAVSMYGGDYIAKSWYGTPGNFC